MSLLPRIFARLRQPPTAGQRHSMEFPAFPKIDESQVAVVCVEAWTGIPLNLEGQRHRASGGEVYRVFPSLADARAFAERAVDENIEIDCALFDHAAQYLEDIRPKRLR